MPKIILPYLETICCADKLGARGRETKLAIMSAAIALFIEKGVYRTPVHEICTKAGVAKGTFYLYFETKEAVIDALYEYLFHAMEQAFLGIRQPEPTLEGLEQSIDALVLNMSSFSELMRFVHRPEIMAIGKTATWTLEAQHMTPMLLNWMQAAKAQGVVRKDVSPLTVQLLYQMIHDAIEREFLFPSDFGMDQVLAEIKVILRRVLLP